MPLCNTVAEKTFDGKLYKGLKNDDGTISYFNCNNGVITKKWYSTMEVFSERRWEWRFDINDYGYVDYYDDETILNTLIILKSNAPKGTSWTAPGSSYVFTIADKGIKFNHKGREYTDVIKVQVVKGENVATVNLGSDLNKVSFITDKKITVAVYHYYAKNIGWLYFEDVMEEIRNLENKKNQDIIAEQKAFQKRKEVEGEQKITAQRKEILLAEKKYNDSIQDLFLFKGEIDPSLEGSYKFFNYNIKEYLFYQFNSNGTFKYYVYEVKPENLKKEGQWKISNDTLKLLYNVRDRNYYEKSRLQKINNAFTGKASLLIDHGIGPFEFETMNNKEPWPNLPLYGDSNIPKIKETPKLEGNIDKEMVGVWIMTSTKGIVTNLLSLNADGTGKEKKYSLKGRQYEDDNFEWRVLNDKMKKMRNCGDGLKCFSGELKIEKTKSGSKVRQIKIHHDIYERQ